MGWYNSSITSLCLILSNTSQSISLWLLKTLWKCGPNTEEFSALVVASSPLVSHICMTVGEAWWRVCPPEIQCTLFNASLGLKRIECIFMLDVQTTLLLLMKYYPPPLFARSAVVSLSQKSLIYLYQGFCNHIAARLFLWLREVESRNWNVTRLCYSDCLLLRYWYRLLECACYSWSM